jgi:hypothetical protein
VRSFKNDLRKIEVFFEGKHVCTAKPAHELTPEDRARFLESRRSQFARASSARRAATAKKRARIAPLTKSGQAAVDPRPRTKKSADRKQREAGGSNRLPKGARDLLGLDKNDG